MPAAVIADLRSDTVTQPTAAMRQAMMGAAVGDDVLGDDPTVKRLEQRAAELLGKEAALFTPSGTMANQLAIRVHTSHGDAVICHRDSHAFYYESGGPAALSGVSGQFLDGPRGQFKVSDVEAVLRPPHAHFAPARLVIIENTHNRGGGSIWAPEAVAGIAELARSRQLAMHLDGARLMNACVARSCQPQVYTRHFDTVSLCFSKGLGAPVGSVLAGPADLIRRAHRFRKMFGGGMRQSGMLCAAALYALDHHVERLAEDHANATRLAIGLSELATLEVDADAVETNMVFCNTHESLGDAATLCRKLAEHGVLLLPESPRRLRAVTHLDVGRTAIDQALEIIRRRLN